VRLSEGVCALIEPPYGPPLGAFETEYQSRRLRLSPGEALVLYTDGATEARRHGELFGEQRLISALCSATDWRPSALVKRLRDAVKSFAGELRDDMQILALRRPDKTSSEWSQWPCRGSQPCLRRDLRRALHFDAIPAALLDRETR
jgi:hypothetical protein